MLQLSPLGGEKAIILIQPEREPLEMATRREVSPNSSQPSPFRRSTGLYQKVYLLYLAMTQGGHCKQAMKNSLSLNPSSIASPSESQSSVSLVIKKILQKEVS